MFAWFSSVLFVIYSCVLDALFCGCVIGFVCVLFGGLTINLPLIFIWIV